MLSRPTDLADRQVAEALDGGWGLRADHIEYAAVGFGSYHWRVQAVGERWFVTVDDLVLRKRHRSESLAEPFRRLAAALSTARSLADSGAHFVIAPRPAIAGGVVHTLDERFAVALYPHVEGATHPWGPFVSGPERLAVLDLIVQLHEAHGPARTLALVDDLAIPDRDRLTAALADLARPWRDGPFGERARALLARHARAVEQALGRYDGLSAVVAGRAERMVLTHGEPHRGNTITTPRGVVLIDWDTARLAPPERDLWALAEEDAAILERYATRTGTVLDDEALELYRLWWDLTEISIFIGQFREAHVANEDTQLGWDGLCRYLDPGRWIPRSTSR